MLFLDSQVKGKGDKQRIEVVVLDPQTNQVRTLRSPVHSKQIVTGQLKELQPFSMTKPLSKKEAHILHQDIEQDPKLDVSSYVHFDHGYHHVIAYGNTQELNKLSSHFEIGNPTNVKPSARKSKISNTKWIRMQAGTPFGLLQEEKGILKPKGTLSLEEFMNLKTATFDSEWMFWEEQINKGWLRNSKENLVSFLETFEEYKDKDMNTFLTSELVDMTREIINKNISKIINPQTAEKVKLRENPFFDEKPMTFQIGDMHNGQPRINYFQYLVGESGVETTSYYKEPVLINTVITKDEHDLVNRLTRWFNEQKYSIIITQNGMKYDFLKAKNYSFYQQKERKKEVDFSIQKKRPTIKNSSGFYNTVVTPSIIHIDMAVYSQHYFPFSRTNKFTDVMSLVLGERVIKTQNYEDLTTLSIEHLVDSTVRNSGKMSLDTAILESDKDAQIYGSGDVYYPLLAANYFKLHTYLKARLFQASIEDVHTVSKRNLAKNLYDVQLVINKERTNYWSIEDDNEYKKFNAFKSFIPSLSEYAQERLKNQGKLKGMTEGVIYFLAPFTYASYKDMVAKDPNVGLLFEQSRQLRNQDETQASRLGRFDILNTLENGYLMPYIFKDLKQGFKNPKRKDNFQRAATKLSDIIEEFDIINYSDNFFCFPVEVTKEQAFVDQMKGIATKVMQGPVFHVKKGKFVAHDGVNQYRFGIDTMGRNGAKPTYAREMIKSAFDSMFFVNPLAAIKDIDLFFKGLTQGRVDYPDKLVYLNKKMAKNYFDYSAPAQQMDIVKAYIQEMVKKGDSFNHVKLADGWVQYDTFKKMPREEMFSPENIKAFKADYYDKLSHIIEPLLATTNYFPEYIPVNKPIQSSLF